MKNLLLALCLLCVSSDSALGSEHLAGELTYCPVSYRATECLDQSTVYALERAHELDSSLSRVQDWELEALEVIAGQHRTLVDLVPGDCGAFGIAHFQPPDGLDLGWKPGTECAFDDPSWRQEVEDVVYGPYSATFQLRTWRRLMGPALHAAGYPAEEGHRVVITVLTNSMGSGGFLRSAREHDWHLESVLWAYVADHPSRHRRNRARALAQFLN